MNKIKAIEAKYTITFEDGTKKSFTFGDEMSPDPDRIVVSDGRPYVEIMFGGPFYRALKKGEFLILC